MVQAKCTKTHDNFRLKKRFIKGEKYRVDETEPGIGRFFAIGTKGSGFDTTRGEPKTTRVRGKDKAKEVLQEEKETEEVSQEEEETEEGPQEQEQ